MNTIWGREPVLIIALVGAIVALVVGFGAGVTDEQVGLIMGAVVALLGVITRQQVSPYHADEGAEDV